MSASTAASFRAVLAGSMVGSLSGVRLPEPAAARSGSRRVRVLVRERRVLPAVRNDWLAEAQPGLAELRQLGRAQVRMPLLHVSESLLHPFELVLTLGAEHSALADCAEKLIARSIEDCLWSCGISGGGAVFPVLTLPAIQRATSFHALATPFLTVGRPEPQGIHHSSGI